MSFGSSIFAVLNRRQDALCATRAVEWSKPEISNSALHQLKCPSTLYKFPSLPVFYPRLGLSLLACHLLECRIANFWLTPVIGASRNWHIDRTTAVQPLNLANALHPARRNRQSAKVSHTLPRFVETNRSYSWPRMYNCLEKSPLLSARRWRKECWKRARLWTQFLLEWNLRCTTKFKIVALSTPGCAHS